MRFVVLLIWVLCGCSQPRPTLIVAALPQELLSLLPHLTDQREVALSSGTALTGMLDDHYVAIMTTGVGLVNAAAATQRGIDALNPSRVLMVGVAGALDPDLELGAVVIPAGWVNHQAGKIEAGGFMSVTNTIPADLDLLTLAQLIPSLSVGGLGASGDVFVDDAAFRDALFARTGAQVVDMESAAVAQVSAQNNTPFLIIRAVSDRAGGEANGEIALSFEAAAQAACDALRGIIRGL